MHGKTGRKLRTDPRTGSIRDEPGDVDREHGLKSLYLGKCSFPCQHRYSMFWDKVAGLGVQRPPSG